MFKKFIDWFKSLFSPKKQKSPLAEFVEKHPNLSEEFKESSTGVMFDYQKHKYINFLAAPVMYFPKSVSNPLIGFVRQLDMAGSDNKPAIVFADHIHGADVIAVENFRLFSQKELKEAMELNIRDRLKFLYPGEDFESFPNEPGPSTYEEIIEKLEQSKFYDTATMYFRMDARET